jgi:hypothetical protein
MQLVIARGELLDQILNETYGIWNEGLTSKAYAQRNAAQMRTTWGASRLHRVALVSADGQLLSSAKRYRFDATLAGQPVQIVGIGALFTPAEMRGRGYASAIIDHVLREESAAGTQLAALFSEIDPAFYERRSFARVVLDEVTVRVNIKGGGTPAMLVRAGTEADLPALAAMHESRAARAGFSLRRDPSLIQFSLTRMRLLAGLGPPGLRQVEFFVVEEGSTAVAYVILSISKHGWTLDEAGDRDPAGARLGALLQVLVAREPSRGVPLIRAWWPRVIPVPPQLELTHRTNPRDVLMMRSLGGLPLPDGGDVLYWRSDFF